MAGRCGIEPDHQLAELREREPERHRALQHAAIIVTATTLACNDKHDARAACLRRTQKAQQDVMGFGLAIPVQVEARIDPEVVEATKHFGVVEAQVDR